jgi:lipopolysaccharide export system protein LptA
MSRWIINVALAAACAVPAVWARVDDRTKPINISADHVEIDDQQGVSRYSGAVKYSQGTMHLEADTATIYSDQRVLKRFVANGSPARYSQVTDTEGVEIRAHADEIEYLVDTEHLLFRGSAHLSRGGDEFAGNLIEYDARNDVVSAHGDESGEGRVHVVIQPRRESETPPADEAPPAGEAPEPAPAGGE